MSNLIPFHKEVSLYENNHEFFFNLKELASLLGYSSPKVAVSDFKRRNNDIPLVFVEGPNRLELCDEPTMFFFMQRSGAPKAREWQWRISNEVLLPARKVGLKAIKELAASQLLNQNRLAPELLPEVAELVEDPVDFLLSNNAYRVLGYLPPSDIHSSVKEFWGVVEEVGIENFQAVYVPKYNNSYTVDGKWYAFMPFSILAIRQPDEPELDITLDDIF